MFRERVRMVEDHRWVDQLELPSACQGLANQQREVQLLQADPQQEGSQAGLKQAALTQPVVFQPARPSSDFQEV